MTEHLPPLDPDAGLVRRACDADDHIIIEVQTAGEALDQNARLAQRSIAAGAAYWPDRPDEMHVAEDGRPIAVYFTAAALRQRDAGNGEPDLE